MVKGLINEAEIRELVAEKLEGTDLFIVDVTVKPTNKIFVEVGGYQGVPIEKCVEISRHIEQSLDREEEDFELNVSSPGVGNPLKVLEQYKANIGRNLLVERDGVKPLKGELINVTDQGITLKVEEKKKESKEEIINYSDIKQAKVLVSFK